MIREVLTLSKVELFKFGSTRATVWLSIGSLLVSLAVVVGTTVFLINTGQQLSAGASITLATLPVGIFVPVAAILVFTSDWQTGEMATFFAVIRARWSLFLAKGIAALCVAVFIFLSLVIFALVATAVGGLITGADAQWNVLEPIGTLLAAVVIGALCGAALGAMLLSAPLAIAVSIVQTLLIDPSLGLIPNGIGAYLRVGSITGDWASLPSPLAAATSALLWIVVPMTVGAIRFNRREP